MSDAGVSVGTCHPGSVHPGIHSIIQPQHHLVLANNHDPHEWPSSWCKCCAGTFIQMIWIADPGWHRTTCYAWAGQGRCGISRGPTLGVHGSVLSVSWLRSCSMQHHSRTMKMRALHMSRAAGGSRPGVFRLCRPCCVPFLGGLPVGCGSFRRPGRRRALNPARPSFVFLRRRACAVLHPGCHLAPNSWLRRRPPFAGLLKPSRSV